MNIRKLATVKKITHLKPIKNADRIESAAVDGWDVVVKKGEFNVGDVIIYIEIDSWVPTEIAPFLSNGHPPKEFKGIKGERLRTVKLRGKISQGLIIPNNLKNKKINDDVSYDLGIIKWEATVPVNLRGLVKGVFPSFLTKTYQERVQNIEEEISRAFDSGEMFEITEKIDGASMTAYNNNLEIGICSKNIDFKLSDSNNSFIKVGRQTDILKCIEYLGRNIAIQGELFGEGIRKNKERIQGNNFALFDIFDIDNGRYLLPGERQEVYNELLKLGFKGTHVKIIDICKMPFREIDKLLIFAQGKKSTGIEREGLVYKSCTRNFSFKTISNKFLLKG
jgi:RNA ligase (TIGR02306 family)